MEKDSKITKIKKSFFGSKKRIIITGIAIVLVGFFAWRAFGQGAKKPQYQTSSVTKGTIISSVNESGNVASGSQAGVGSPTTGIVTDIFVKDGDSVTQGQNLFKVKSIASAQEIASAWSSYLSASTSLNTAMNNKTANQSKLEQDRAAAIAASSAVTNMQNNINTSQNNPSTKLPFTQNDIDGINSAKTSADETFKADEQKYLQSDQSIAAASAAKNSAWLSYQATQDSVVVAPIAVAVANIVVKPGDQVPASGGKLSSNQSSNSTSSTNNAILYIGKYANPYLKLQASEIDINNIKSGQKATITLSAFPDQTFVGTVDQVDSSGTISSGVVTYNVFISFVAPVAEIKPGMSATVTIQTAIKNDVLSVPLSAIQTSSGQSTVRVMKNGQITSVPVETGISSDSDTEIISGLSEGDTVVTGTISTSTQTTTGSSPFSGLGGGRGGFGGGGGGAVIRSGGRGG